MNVFSVATEIRHSGAFLTSEAPQLRSRVQGTLVNLAGSDIIMPAGLVMASAAYLDATAAPLSGNTRNGTLSGLSFGPDATVGTYQVEFASPTAFTVLSPSGHALRDAVPGFYDHGRLDPICVRRHHQRHRAARRYRLRAVDELGAGDRDPLQHAGGRRRRRGGARGDR